MAGTKQQTYNERSGAAINPITESDAVEWSLDPSLNVTGIIRAIQTLTGNMGTDITNLRTGVNNNTTGISTNAAAISALSALVAQKANETDVASRLAGKQDKLIAGNNIQISGNTISADAPITNARHVITIDNFDTFGTALASPLIDRNSGAAFTLSIGESCDFYSSYATGRPSMEGAGGDPFSSSTYSGQIQRLSTTEYRVIAMMNQTVINRPSMASRSYTAGSSVIRPWLVGSEFFSNGSSGFVRFPSGLMMQWGYVTSSGTAAAYTLTYPYAFGSALVHLTVCPRAATNTKSFTIMVNGTNTSTASIYRSEQTSGNSAISISSIGFYWLAIGQW